jgi:PDZ domain-containing protein
MGLVSVRETRPVEYRNGLWAALAALGLLALAAAPARAQTMVPAIRFHEGAEELAAVVGGADPEEDARWVRGHADELVSWWERQGPVFLARAGAISGLPWSYRDIEVYLVRRWPVISIEYPLVLALDEVDGGGEPVEIPDDEDLQVLLLAHQLTHYLLDDPTFLPREQRAATYEHPFLAPGDFEVEAMVNWVTYTVLEELWGRQRLQRATEQELWRQYNPNHLYVVDELVPRWRLTPTTTLVQWLAGQRQGSEIFRIRDAYARQRREPEPTPETGQNLSGTPYGIDLGGTFEGRIFVSYVDPASPADRAGVKQGDVVATIEGREVGRDVVDAQRRLDESWQDGEINLSVQRDGREVFLTVERR